MKYKVNAIIIVEGTSDVSKLNSILDSEYIVTNGSEISKETLDTIETLSKNHTIIIMTDPDSPGKKIRDIISTRIPAAKHAFVDKKHSIKKNKVGVAECDEEEILRALKDIKTLNANYKEIYSLKWFMDNDIFEINTVKFKDFISYKYHIDKCNTKKIIKRLNQLEVSKKDLLNLVEEFRHGA